MSRTSFAARGCPVARSLDVIGDAWTLLVVRDLLFGVRRFDALQADLGISRKVLADRLARLVGHGIVTRSRYHERPPRYEYWLTRKGLELQPVLLTLARWSARWHTASGEAPLEYVHTDCGEVTEPTVSCDRCAKPLTVHGIRVRVRSSAGEREARRIEAAAGKPIFLRRAASGKDG